MLNLNFFKVFTSFIFVSIASVAVAENEPLLGLDRIEKAAPWKAVGRLDTKNGFCTGTLIAPDLVLTAAHCTYDSKNNVPSKPSDLTFRAGFRHGKAQAERKVVQIARPDEYDFDGIDDEKNIRSDIALLLLAQPIASHIIHPFHVETRTLDSGPVAVVSYGSGREDLPSLQRECQVIGARRGVVSMDCDVTFGSSGAPVFLRTLGKVRIASVISGIASFNGKQRTVGMALPKTVDMLRAKLRANVNGPVAKVRRVSVGARGGSSAKFVSADGH